MSTVAKWPFNKNFIFNAVNDNYSKALKASTYHFNALTEASGDSDIAAMLTLFTPKHNALLAAATAKGVVLGSRKGKTKTVKELLQDVIDTHLPAWQQTIGNTYTKKSAEFLALFPQKTKPFETGKIENRILAIRTLRDACTADEDLATVAATIAAFYTIINNARNAQLGKKEAVTSDTEDQVDTIFEMCVVHFSNHGKLIGKYPTDPLKIASFTDVETLQSHSKKKDDTNPPA